MAADDMDHLRYLPAIAEADVSVLQDKEATYQGSWKRAGGRSAWFMMRRNMDRLLSMMARVEFKLRPDEIPTHKSEHLTLDFAAFTGLLKALRSEDLFAVIQAEPSGADGTVLACLRDLRRYATLVEAEMVAEGHVQIEYGPSFEGRTTPAEPDDVIEPGPGIPEKLLDQVLRLTCPEWSDEIRAQSVAVALNNMPGASVYNQASFVSGVPRDELKAVVLGRIYGFVTEGVFSHDAGLAPLTLMIERAVSHAVNYTGLDARLNTPDHVLAELLTPRIVAFLAERTDGQILDAGWTISADGEGRAIPPEGWPGFPRVKLMFERGTPVTPGTEISSDAPPRWSEADPAVDAVTALADDPSEPGSPADGGHHAPSMAVEWSSDMGGLTQRLATLLDGSNGYVRASVEIQRRLSPVETVFFSLEPSGEITFKLVHSGRVLDLDSLEGFESTSWRTDSIRAQRPMPTWEDVA